MTHIVKAEWLSDGRRMRILNDVIFIDEAGVKWIAPSGSIVDGASIPRFFWRIIGGPFSGKYRYASVIHDVYCINKSKPHQMVHKMFHEAMIKSGVSKWKAWWMHRAVSAFGPKWDS